MKGSEIMVKFALHYARYALTALLTVGFFMQQQ
jgi:hypothetical protein